MFQFSHQPSDASCHCGTKLRPGRCPEIPEILKVVRKFTPRPECFADVLNFFRTYDEYCYGHASIYSQLHGMDAPGHVRLRHKLEVILVL